MIMQFTIDFMGSKTIISKATTTGGSLRTTIPIGIVKQFSLTEGDKLEWELKAENGTIIVIIKPERK
jgi:antitoxin component of MazEF toxin-antitoxin module